MSDKLEFIGRNLKIEDEAIFNSDNIIIVPNFQDDRPVKVVFEDRVIDSSESVEFVSEYQRISDTLRYMKNRDMITTAQYRSVRGQARRGNIKDPIAFIKWIGYYDYYKGLDEFTTVFTFKMRF